MTEKDAIGSFTFAMKPGLLITVRLLLDGRWWSDFPAMTRYLEFVYPVARNSSPAHGTYGRMVLELAATDFKAEVIPPPGGWQNADPGVIY